LPFGAALELPARALPAPVWNQFRAWDLSSCARALERIMDESKVEGVFRNAAGRVQDAAGGLAGDAGLQARGKVNQAAGEAQQIYGDTVDRVKDFAVEQPGKALAAALGLGVLIGFTLGRR